MKKFIQVSSILSLLFVFMAVSAFAQSTKQYQAQIPFDFNVGEKTFQSGSYVIKIIRQISNGLTLRLETSEGKPLEAIFVADSGLFVKGNPQIVFNRYGNQRFLSKLQSENFSVSIGLTKAEKTVADKFQSEESVEIKPNK